MPRRISLFQTLISSSAITTVTAAVDVRDYRNCVISLGATAAANMKVFFKGAIGEVAPAFGSPRALSNQWDYVDVADLQNGNSIDGDTGIALTAADAPSNVRLFELNINALDWFAVHQTNVITGSLIVLATFATNE